MGSLIRVLCFFLFSIKWGVPSSVNRLDSEIKLFQTSESFTVESTAVLSELDKEVGFKVKAILNVRPVWKDTDNEYLLKFNLQSPQLLSKAKSPDYTLQTSLWNNFPNTEFYAHWKNGIIIEAYLDSSEPVDVLNLKKSVISLFQFNVFESEGNETDVSGVCEVQYEAVSMHNIKKIKRHCAWSGSETNNDVVSRRITRYTLGEELNTISEIHAEEMHELDDGSLQAHAWLRLLREPEKGGQPLQLSSGQLSDTLQQLPPTLQSLPLTMSPPPEEPVERLTTEELGALLEKEAEALGGAEPGEGGTVDAAASVLRLLPALRNAQRATLSALLHKYTAEPDLLSGLCRLLGLAGTGAAHRAAHQLLQLRDDASPALAHHYLHGLALAPEPQESVVTEVLRLGEEITQKDVAESALLAAAAAASRLPADSSAPRALRDTLARSLARCKDDECRAVRLLALGNTRRADAAEPLLQHAERAPPGAALAALAALERLPPAALPAPRRARLLHLALEPRPLELRAAALDLLLRHSEPPPPLELLSALNERAPAELRRLLWQRLAALADEQPRWREALAALPVQLRGWHARAAPGTSALLVREAGASGGWRARLESVQLTRAGLLRRATVTLSTLAPGGSVDDTLAVELWARGLQSLAGGEADADGAEPEDEAVAGGLAFTVGGARTRSLTLFESQGELLGHVWAGTGSEPTSVLRALRPLRPTRAVLPLLGAGPLRLTRHAAVAMAMDAQAQVSLWSRNARTALTLRGAVVSESRASVGGASEGAALRAHAQRSAQPRLHIAADVDFYGSTAMCVRVSTDPYERIHNVTLQSMVGGAKRRVRRAARWAGAGRTLSLGALNDVTCTTLGAL